MKSAFIFIIFMNFWDFFLTVQNGKEYYNKAKLYTFKQWLSVLCASQHRSQLIYKY